MNWEIVFTPLIPSFFLWLGLSMAAALTLISLWQGQRGAAARGGALALLLLTLANPTILEEERDPIKDVAAIMIDRSPSQTIADRPAITEAALEQLKTRLEKLPNLDIRILETSMPSNTDRDEGTRLFDALDSGLSDVPPERLAGAIILSDGQIHDAPESTAALGFDAPIHTLLTGRPNERDRKLTIEQAPRFGIVGETVSLTIRVDDFGGDNAAHLAEVKMHIDGREQSLRRLITGRSTTLEFDLAHGGQNVVEIAVSSLEDELTLHNNRAVVLINGIRDHLRVLLVSGEPHAGERTWRNLLKADPSVDLVHFTILRPPEKQDGTPIGELALIEFPTRQLFSVKLDEFDLVIFDRYRRRGVLPSLYLENVANFVEKGGALLTAAGPAFASPYSLYRSPLSAVLPGQPTGEIVSGGYHPAITDLGERHPVTADLAGTPIAAPQEDISEAPWGRWFRLIDSVKISGETVMSGPEKRPLLILDRVGEGRVAQLMSDHAWLWARGYEGGGPQAEMLRRLAHWLMKEPDLEEEDLYAEVQGNNITVTRRTMADFAGSITLTSPTGKTQTLMPENTAPGIWTATTQAEEFGLYRLNDIALTAVAGVGPLNPKEFSDIRTTEEILKPVATMTKGGLFWTLKDETATPNNVSLPSIRLVDPGRDTAGRNWIGLKQNKQYNVRALSQSVLLVPLLALLLILSALLFTWYREGR